MQIILDSSTDTLRRHELEARRLRAEFTHDLTVRLLIAADLAVRRLAYRIATGLGLDSRERVPSCR
jgi:hypothetical protein